jgi:DNA-binding NtrC family response regulator
MVLSPHTIQEYSVALKILVIDDDQIFCRLLKAIFISESIEVLAAHDGVSGLQFAQKENPDVVLVDIKLPGMSGLEVLEKLMSIDQNMAVIMITAFGEVQSAIRATQLGASDYLEKRGDSEEIIRVVKRVIETRNLKKEVQDLRKQVGLNEGLRTQMGPSLQVQKISEHIRTIAPTDFTVLILGETGTGKEVVAQSIHKESDRKHKPFIALDCGAIPENLLESELFGHERGAFTGADRKKAGQFHLAQGGTLFLDEIGNMPIHLQAKLLRVLESRQFQPVGAAQANAMDVRFLAATNIDLQSKVTSGEFRADLYFRLAQYTIPLYPLRERREDIPYLAQRFLEEVSIELKRPARRFLPQAMEILKGHDWPGNVRELRNIVRQAILQTTELDIGSDALSALTAKQANARYPQQIQIQGKTLREIADNASREAERLAINETLKTTKGNKSQAAKILQTDYKTLHIKIKALGIRTNDFVN